MFVRTAASCPFHNLQLGRGAQMLKPQSKACQKGRTCHLVKGNSARSLRLLLVVVCGLVIVLVVAMVVVCGYCGVYRASDHHPQPVCGSTNLQEGLCSREFKNTAADGLETVATSNWNFNYMYILYFVVRLENSWAASTTMRQNFLLVNWSVCLRQSESSTHFYLDWSSQSDSSHVRIQHQKYFWCFCGCGHSKKYLVSKLLVGIGSWWPSDALAHLSLEMMGPSPSGPQLPLSFWIDLGWRVAPLTSQFWRVISHQFAGTFHRTGYFRPSTVFNRFFLVWFW